MNSKEIKDILIGLGFNLLESFAKYEFQLNDITIIYQLLDLRLKVLRGNDLIFNIVNIEKQPNHNYLQHEITDQQFSEVLVWIREQKFKSILDE